MAYHGRRSVMSGILMATIGGVIGGSVNFVVAQYATQDSVTTPILSTLGVVPGDLALYSSLNSPPAFLPAGRSWVSYGSDGAFTHYYLVLLASEVNSSIRLASNTSLMIYRGAAVSAQRSALMSFSTNGSATGVAKSPKHAGFVAMGYSQSPAEAVQRITSVGPDFTFRGDKTVVLPERLSSSGFDRLVPPAPQYSDFTQFTASCPSPNCFVAIVELLTV